MVTWQAARAALQGVWAIAIARLLGPSAYGAFAGFAGLATTLGAATGLGFGLLMLQMASRDMQRFPAYWYKALAAISVSGAALGALYLAVAPAVTGHEASLIVALAICVPEVICLPLVITASQAFQAHERMGWAGAMYALGPAGNLAAAALFMFSGQEPSLANYLAWHLAASLVTTSIAVAAVGTILRPVYQAPSIDEGDLSEAAGFTAMRAADSGLASIDKTLVLRLAGEEVAGHYTAAYRLAAFIALPAISLAISAAPRLFRLAASDAAQASRIVASLLRIGLLAALAGMPLIWALSYAIPVLFGAAFQPASALAQWMAPFPGLLGLSALGASLLMAMGKRSVRIIVQSAAAALLVCIMAVLAPAGSGRGAVAALLLTYASLAVAMWWAVTHRGHPRPE